MKADTVDAHCPDLSGAPAPDQEPPPAQKPLAYRASFLVAIPGTPYSSQPNCRKSLNSHFRSVQTPGASGETAAAAALAVIEAAAAAASAACPASLRCFRGSGGAGSVFWQGSRLAATFPLFFNGRRRVCAVGKPFRIRPPARTEAAFPQLTPVFLQRLMDPERERTGRHLKKGRKRRRAPNALVGAAEAMRARWDLEERQPEAKKARLSAILFAENCEVTHDQLCELLKYAVLGKSSVPKPSWCQLFHQNHLNNVVVFVLQGMSQLHFYRFYLEFGFLRKAFRHKFRLPPPSSNFLADIIGLQKKQTTGDLSKMVEGSLPSASSKVSINLQNDPIIQKYGSKKVGLTRCLLTREEMKTFHFPLQGFPDCENFVLTKCNGSITDNSPLFGLDCEICLTSKGRELTRISLVAEGGCCVMDELVKPDNKILDYLTSFSGITKKILNPVTTKLKDVQRHLKALLPPDAVLVGHSLDLDLRALKMIHPYVIDTSLLYVREQGRRFKLKFLAKAILGKDIQCPDRLGHDATEDARTTLELARYFLKYGPRKLVHVVPDRFILGLDGAGVLWNFAILTGYLGICAFLIYIWRTVLAIAPRQYEVTLQQIAEKIHRLKNENRELAKEISIWEEKIREGKKHRAEMKREHQFLSDKILKLKENIGKVERVNANLSVALHFKRTMLQAMREKNVKNEDMAQDALEDEEQGDLESKKRVLKESKKVLEQKCNALSSLKAAKEVELKLLRKKLGIMVDFSERRKVAAEEKLEKTLYELEATKNQLSDAEENLKVTKEEIDKYKQQIREMQDQLQEAELTFERKITVHEKNAVGNWIKARVWERKIQQQRRENAYMIHRLRMMKGQMLPEGCMRQEVMLGRPEMWSPPRRGHWSDTEVGGAPMRNNGTEPNRDPGMYKVGPDVRRFPWPTCMSSHTGQTLPGFIGSVPPQPPPPWSTCGPRSPFVPPPCGPWSHSEACGAQGDNSGTAPKEVPEMDKLVHVVPDRFILGLDGAGVLWNFAILTGYLGICAFLIYIWRTVLAIAPRQYEVTLQQIAEKIHRLKNENRELAKEISIWEEKIRERKKHRAEMKREHQFVSDKILKLKENIGKVERVNANLSVTLHFKRTMLQAMREKNVKNEDMAQDALEDEEQGALESKKRVLKESKKVLEQKCNALSSLKAAKEVELKLLRKKLGIVMDFSERRKVAAEEKLEKTLYELEATKNQLSDAEENLKVTKEEIDKYKSRLGFGSGRYSSREGRTPT
ncbi:uncharacterized protein LOC113270720 isoform X2 [Ursus arctos]|uniref:uncharacterized protein LOC113270720 isoform X2 n=1 Tax=Ursus arctos TaxID=9644 RepID=UPI002548A4BD|nr:uncharacterized protein LOC113270720 isoform X2 [Ursus arctos]